MNSRESFVDLANQRIKQYERAELDQGVKWFNTEFYPKYKTGRAARYEDGVLPRLKENEVILFTPWGPRYGFESRGTEIQTDDREFQTLELLRDRLGQMQGNMPGKSFRWLFLGADTYGTEINKLPEQAVRGRKRINSPIPLA